MKNLIPDDNSRCNNHRCAMRSDCARYMQLELDAKKNNPLHSVTRFGNPDGHWTETCGHFIDANPMPNA